MKNLVFLWDYRDLFSTISKYSNYNKIVIVDKNRRSFDDCRLLQCFNEIIEVNNIYDKKEMHKTIEWIIDKKGEIEAILAPFEGIVEMGGYLRTSFNIQGLKEDVADKFRNKFVMKDEVRKNDVKTANSKIINDINEAKEFVNENKYPVILKPLYGYATLSTYKIDNENELNSVFKEINETCLDNLKEKGFLMEQYIKGEEYYCDSIIIDGKVVFETVSKYLFNCIDTIANIDKPVGGILYPNDYNEVESSIKAINKKVIKALGIERSICHMEVFVEESGQVVFSEIAARIGGGEVIPPCTLNSYGINMYDAFVELEFNEFNQKPKDCKDVFTGFVMLPIKEGKVVAISNEDYLKDEKVVYIDINRKVGDVVKLDNSSNDKTGFIVLESNSEEGLRRALNKAYNNFVLEVE